MSRFYVANTGAKLEDLNSEEHMPYLPSKGHQSTDRSEYPSQPVLIS